jgi:hypothetical protein
MRLITNIAFWLLTIPTLLMVQGCEKVLLKPDPASHPEAVFEALWQDVRNRYSYFELKNIDWEEVRVRYAALITPDLSSEALFEVLADMLFELEDGHVNLTTAFDRSRNWDWFQDFPVNYNQAIVDRQYLGRNFRITGPFRSQIIDSVLYVNYRSFSDDISLAAIEALIDRMQGLKGVIVDVRNNGGGALNNATRLASAFSNESYTYGQVRIKNGPCDNCFSSWTPLRVIGRNGTTFDGKVIVLTNRASYSSTTYFAQMMRENPNVVLMGQPTGGGGGSPVFGELPNGWTYRFSATQAVALNGAHFELGIPVDVLVDLEKGDEDQGIDTMIERALAALR